MDFVIVRHGQTEMNALNATRDIKVCGRYDTPLTQSGIDDAKKLASNEHLKSIDVVYSSDISRAYNTAKYAMPEHEPIVTELLRERSLGVFEGQEVSSLKSHPEYSKYFTDEALKTFRHGFGPRAPGGENYADVLARIEKFFQGLDLTSEKTAAIFSHICAIRCILIHLLELDKQQSTNIWVPNCKPIVVRYKNNKKKFELVEPKLEQLK